MSGVVDCAVGNVRSGGARSAGQLRGVEVKNFSAQSTLLRGTKITHHIAVSVRDGEGVFKQSEDQVSNGVIRPTRPAS